MPNRSSSACHTKARLLGGLSEATGSPSQRRHEVEAAGYAGDGRDQQERPPDEDQGWIFVPAPQQAANDSEQEGKAGDLRGLQHVGQALSHIDAGNPCLKANCSAIAIPFFIRIIPSPMFRRSRCNLP